MKFGFSFIGVIYLAMLLIPNFLWAKRKPKGYETYVVREKKGLVALERLGEGLVTCSALLFSGCRLGPWTLWSWWLVASFLLMVLYELYWLRYFRSPQTMEDFYASFLGIPVAGATLPVAAFGLLAVYGVSPALGLSVVILGIGHIGIHWMHWKELP